MGALEDFSKPRRYLWSTPCSSLIFFHNTLESVSSRGLHKRCNLASSKFWTSCAQSLKSLDSRGVLLRFGKPRDPFLDLVPNSAGCEAWKLGADGEQGLQRICALTCCLL